MENTIMELLEVSSEKNGAKIIFATDDFFGVAENILKEEEPVSKKDEYTKFGKWVDGWETRRRISAMNDYAIIALAAETQIHHICVDTSFLNGDLPIEFSVRGAKLSKDELKALVVQDRKDKLGGKAEITDYDKIDHLSSQNWPILIPTQKLDASNVNTRKNFAISTTEIFTHLRLDIFPDGGIARLRVYGTIQPLINRGGNSIIDFMSRINGCVCVRYSDFHRGHPDNITKPDEAKGPADGWLTPRSPVRSSIVDFQMIHKYLTPGGNKWAVFKLGYAGNIAISEVIVDMTHFRGNLPQGFQIDTGFSKEPNQIPTVWKTIVPFFSPLPNKNLLYVEKNWAKVSHIKLTMVPDGGLCRLRMFGTICKPSQNR